MSALKASTIVMNMLAATVALTKFFLGYEDGTGFSTDHLFAILGAVALMTSISVSIDDDNSKKSSQLSDRE